MVHIGHQPLFDDGFGNGQQGATMDHAKAAVSGLRFALRGHIGNTRIVRHGILRSLDGRLQLLVGGMANLHGSTR